MLATRFAYILIYPKLSKLTLSLTSQRSTKESMYRLRSSCTFAMHAKHQSCRIPASGTSISSEPMLPPRSSRSILKAAILALSSFQRNDGTGSSIYQDIGFCAQCWYAPLRRSWGGFALLGDLAVSTHMHDTRGGSATNARSKCQNQKS